MVFFKFWGENHQIHYYSIEVIIMKSQIIDLSSIFRDGRKYARITLDQIFKNLKETNYPIEQIVVDNFLYDYDMLSKLFDRDEFTYFWGVLETTGETRLQEVNFTKNLNVNFKIHFKRSISLKSNRDKLILTLTKEI